MIQNGSFENTSAFPAPWFFIQKTGGTGVISQDSSTSTDGVYSAKIDITSASSSSPWLVQLQQPNKTLAAQQPYTISFFAKAATNKSIDVVVQQTNSPYTLYTSQTFNLTTTWKQYSFTFIPSASETNAFLGFNLASSVGQIWLDDITMQTSNAQTTTPTATPTPLPTRTPTPTLTPTTTPTPTPKPTNTPAPTNTPIPQSTKLSLNLLLQGIGYGGDNQTPNAAGNFTPLSPTREVTVLLFDGNNQNVATQLGTVTFNNSGGNFLGNISFSPPIPLGSYVVKIKSPRYLRRQTPGFITITSSNQTGTISLAQTTLVVGDSNGDDLIDILDFNILLDCYSDLLPPKSCSDETKKTSADLNDDGKVNGVDINLFLRNLSTRVGD
jgi:hypothetical protein